MKNMISTDMEQDIKAVLKINSRICKAFETVDFRGAAAYLTPDCNYITFNGDYLKGRYAYVKTHEELMNSFFFRGARLEAQVTEARFLNDDTAVVIATGAIKLRWQKEAPASRRSITTSVFVREDDDQWRLASFHNCRIKKFSPFAKWLMKIFKS